MPTKTETRDKILQFGEIATGWRFGEGVPPDGYTINAALELNNRFYEAGFLSTDAFLGVGGQIQVNGYWDDFYMEFIIEDHSISYVLETHEKVEIEEEDLSLLDAVSRIQFWGKKWPMSEFSIKMISTSNWEDLPAHPFLNLVLAAYLSSTRTVFGIPDEPSANISHFITRQSPARPQFTSNSPRISYQPSASS